MEIVYNMRKIFLLSMIVVFLIFGCSSNNHSLIYCGFAKGRVLYAISINNGYSLEDLNGLVSQLRRHNTTVLFYKNFRNYSSIEPLAVYEDGIIIYYNPLFKTRYVSDSIQDIIDSSYINGQRIGAICRDGTRSSATGRGACSHHGGVRRWVYEKIKNPAAVIASICNDYLLIAGTNENSDLHPGLLKMVRNRDLDQLNISKTNRKNNTNPYFKNLKIDKKSSEIVKLLNKWLISEITKEPVKIILVPMIDCLPTEIEEICTLLPPYHRSLIETLELFDLEFMNEVRGFDPTHNFEFRISSQQNGFESKMEEIITITKNYFKDRVLQVIEMKLGGDKRLSYLLCWYIVFEKDTKMLYSLILNLEPPDD